MDEEKVQRLHDTLAKYAPKGKSGGLGFQSRSKLASRRDPTLPDNALYSNFVREGSGLGQYHKRSFDMVENKDESITNASETINEMADRKKNKKDKKEKKEKKIKKNEIDPGSLPSVDENLSFEAPVEFDGTSAKKKRRKKQLDEAITSPELLFVEPEQREETQKRAKKSRKGTAESEPKERDPCDAVLVNEDVEIKHRKEKKHKLKSLDEHVVLEQEKVFDAPMEIAESEKKRKDKKEKKRKDRNKVSEEES